MAPNATPIVVDNASSDQTVERVRERHAVQLIANRENRGFAAAVNQGVRAAAKQNSAEFILLLNPDANLRTAVDSLIDAARPYGLACGKLLDSNGIPQSGFCIRRFPTPATLIFELFGINRLLPWNAVNRRYRYLDRDADQAGPVEQPAGAFLMMRMDVWQALGGLDEGFHPVWFEDVDYCRRAVNSGYRIEYVPSVEAVHQGGHAVNELPAGCQAVYWCVSLLRYAAKHFRPIGYRAVCAAVVLSSVPRMVAGMIQQRSLEPVAAFRKIIRIAGLCLISSGRSAALDSRRS